MSATPALQVERQGGTLILALDRPQVANAIDEALHQALNAQLALAQGDQGVRSVVLTASGTRAFSAGADMKEFAGLDPHVAASKRRALLVHTLTALIDFAKPLVAAVQAPALGAGCMLAMLADEVVAADGAQFGMPEIRRGMPSPIGFAIIAARSGPAAARRLVQRGESLDAPQAHALGLIDEVIEAGRLRDRAIERAGALAAHSAAAFAANKRFINAGLRAAVQAAATEAQRWQSARGGPDAAGNHP